MKNAAFHLELEAVDSEALHLKQKRGKYRTLKFPPFYANLRVFASTKALSREKDRKKETKHL